MTPRVPHVAIADTGYWFALFNPKDQYHRTATNSFEFVQTLNILIPWPTLYEAINTRFVKDSIRVGQFERLLTSPNFVRIDDSTYRDEALSQTLIWAKTQKRFISLTDMVIRFMLDDSGIRKDYMLTFNPGDFSDLCRRHRVELTP